MGHPPHATGTLPPAIQPSVDPGRAAVIHLLRVAPDNVSICRTADRSHSAPSDDQKKAAEILNKIWKEQPNHPGVVHYLIHSDDSAQFAQAGLDAAICYAKIAPDVPHALHMPIGGPRGDPSADSICVGADTEHVTFSAHPNSQGGSHRNNRCRTAQ